jgi:hypothetical protein
MATSGSEPFVWSYLHWSLQEYRQQHEAQFALPEDQEGRNVAEAINAIEPHAYRLVRTGEVTEELQSVLARFRPHLTVQERLEELSRRLVVINRLEFDVAQDSVQRLEGCRERVRISLVILGQLLESTPSPVALKYHDRASRLYLAGFDAEAIVMCGAVLESALSARFPDEELKAAGIKPRFARAGVYSLGQRMEYEKEHRVLTDDQREAFWRVVNARNDVVHVDPELGLTSKDALALTAILLSVLLPRVD